MTQISNKVLRDLVREIEKTPGFTCEQLKQHVKITGPDGRTTTLRCGSSGNNRDDRELRSTLRRFVGWPPTNVGAALLEATHGSPALALVPKIPPPSAQTTRERRAEKLDTSPSTPTAPQKLPEPSPAPVAVSVSSRFVPSAGAISWTQAVYLHLRSIAPAERTLDELIAEVPPKEHGLGVTSTSPIMSARWLDAQAGDVFLHIERRRVQRGHTYRYIVGERRVERPDLSKLGEEPALGERWLNEAQRAESDAFDRAQEAKRAAQERSGPIVTHETIEVVDPNPPSVFERIGNIGARLLLLDENGDTWLAQPMKMQRVDNERVITDERGNVWIAGE